jgi:hypothetical protein
MIWTILGMSVAIVAFFCVSVSETLVGHPIFEMFRPYAAIVLGVAGIGGWFLGRALGARRRVQNEEQRFVLFDLRYWGPMFVILGIITVFIRPLRTQESSKPLVAAPLPPPKKAEPAVVVANVPVPPVVPPKPVTFPPLKIQGVIFGSSTPYAIINGQSYTVGDHLGDVVVRAIDRSSVMIELGGEMKVLTLN